MFPLRFRSGILPAALLLSFACTASAAGEDRRVRRALEEADIEFSVNDNDNFRIVWDCETDDRTQLVLINSRTENYHDMELREVWSVAFRGETPVSESRMTELLSENARKKVGAWQMILPRPDESADRHLVIFQIVLPADADGDELRSAIIACAEEADRIEREWVGTDDL